MKKNKKIVGDLMVILKTLRVPYMLNQRLTRIVLPMVWKMTTMIVGVKMGQVMVVKSMGIQAQRNQMINHHPQRRKQGSSSKTLNLIKILDHLLLLVLHNKKIKNQI